MVFLWFSYGFPMVFLSSHAAAMAAAMAHVHMRLAADGSPAAHHGATAQLHGPSALAHGVGVAVGTGVP